MVTHRKMDTVQKRKPNSYFPTDLISEYPAVGAPFQRPGQNRRHQQHRQPELALHHLHQQNMRVHQAAITVLAGFFPEATHPKFGNTFSSSNPADFRNCSTCARL